MPMMTNGQMGPSMLRYGFHEWRRTWLHESWNVPGHDKTSYRQPGGLFGLELTIPFWKRAMSLVVVVELTSGLPAVGSDALCCISSQMMGM